MAEIICVDKEANLVCFKDNNDKLFVLNIDNEILRGQTFPCPHCGKEHEVKDFVLTEDEVMCTDCLNKSEYKQCSECGEYFYKENMAEVGGKHLCHDCFSEKYFVCPDCGSIQEKASGIYIDCLFYCQNCVNTNLENGTFVQCAECGEIFKKDDTYLLDGDYYCSRCYDELADDQEYISEYHDGRPFRFKSLNSDVDYPKNGNLYLGLEHELSYANSENYELAQVITDRFSRVCEYDSSIRDGFEVISDAMTFAYWKKYENLRDYMDTIHEYSDFDPDDSSGIHVHINRGPLSDEAVIEIAWFVMEHYDDCIKFGRRNPCECEYCERVTRDCKEDLWDYATGHGVAVNLEHSSNIELRFFKTTDDVPHMWAILEFSYALAMVAKQGCIDIEWADIRKFCEEDGNEKHFLTELNKKFDCVEVEDYYYEDLSDEILF